MAQHGERYGVHGRQTDEYGNPIRQTDEFGRQLDEYGNPVGGTMGEFGTTGQYGAATGTGGDYGTTGAYGTGTGMGQYGTTGGHGVGTGFGSGERREGQGLGEGLKEKIKEKLPGGHRERVTQSTATTTPGGDYGTTGAYGVGTGFGSGERHEGQGLTEKIKEKLPGGHRERVTQSTPTMTPGYEGQREEKKGVMEKIKEKLPGQHNA
ncbi:unnamed protein product [Ilex paraguariensis]|uniref:Dehydrin n=1 Tax=Ilex paraguariensis TaxID=185542 RepID=A0ABC8SJ13_9AQUA